MRGPALLMCLGWAAAGAAGQVPERLVPEAFAATFAQLAGEQPRLALVCQRGGRALLWSRGRSGGLPVGEQTRVALGTLVQLLLADALTASSHELDAEALRVAGRPVPLRELVTGWPRLPPYVDWSGAGPTVTPGQLLDCAALATRQDWTLLDGAGSLAATVLLEPLLLQSLSPESRRLGTEVAPMPGDGSPAGLAVALRAALAGRVGGFDPVDAASLPERAVAAALGPSMPAVDLRHARPAAARLLLTAQAVANWWQWRLDGGLPMWEGLATLLREAVPGYAGRHRLTGSWSSQGSPLLHVYPSHDVAVLIWAEPSEQFGLIDALERDLYGVAGMVRGAGARRVARAESRPDRFRSLRDSLWRSRPDADAPAHAGAAVELAVVGRDSVALRLGGETHRFERAEPQGDGWRLSAAAGGEGPAGSLWLAIVRDPFLHLEAIWVSRPAGTRAVPRRLRFERVDDRREPAAQRRERLRAVVAAQVPEQPLLAVLCIAGAEPEVYAADRDAVGRAIDDDTLIALGAGGRLLFADAAWARSGGRIDQPVPGRGELPWTVRDLLVGTELLPDWFAWRSGPAVLGGGELLRCAQLARRSGATYPRTSLGMAETALLAALLVDPGAGLAGASTPGDAAVVDALRAAMAPHVPGLAPFDARLLPTQRHAAILQLRDEPELPIRLQEAEPLALRALLTRKSLVAWWRWRVASGPPLWAGPRAAVVADLPGHPGHRWETFAAPGPVGLRVVAFPERRAALLLLDGAGGFGAAEAVVAAVTESLFGEPAPSFPPQLDEFARVLPAEPLAALRDTSWHLAGDDGVRLTIRGPGIEDLELVDGAVRRRSRDVMPLPAPPAGEAAPSVAFQVRLAQDEDGTAHRLLVLVEATAGRRLHVVWQRGDGATFAAPRVLEFVAAPR